MRCTSGLASVGCWYGQPSKKWIHSLVKHGLDLRHGQELRLRLRKPWPPRRGGEELGLGEVVAAVEEDKDREAVEEGAVKPG